MKYTEFKVYASHAGLELVNMIMLNQGIDYISINDPEDFNDILNKKNEYGWDYIEYELKENLDREATLSVFFGEEDDLTIIEDLRAEVEKLKKDVGQGSYGEGFDAGSLTTEINESDDSQWKDKWKEYFHPTKITDRLVVKPSWEDYSPAAGDLVIEIDPGMAFGTGTHETTSLCMKLLEKYMGASAADKDKKSEDVKGSAEGWGLKVLDVGCGSGILSIAAARLGAGDVLGVEIDEDAVLVARENVDLNGCAEGVKVIQGDLTKGIDYKADIIDANLMADLVMMLADSAKAHLVTGGIFISSGILTDKEEIVSSAIVEAGFEIVEVAEDGEWCAIAARG